MPDFGETTLRRIKMTEEEIIFESQDEEDAKVYDLYEKGIISYEQYLALSKKILEKNKL